VATHPAVAAGLRFRCGVASEPGRIRAASGAEPIGMTLLEASPSALASFTLRVEKENMKFSAAHFLIFEDGTAERLHGHNYRVGVELEAGSTRHGVVVDFRVVKDAVASVLAPLDERLLVPERHPLLVREERGKELTLRLGRRRYVLPLDEAAVLPIANTSSECLAEYVAGALLTRLRAAAPAVSWSRVTVAVEETAGQSGVCTLHV
jgi:6-pyruvoyltetrahydropterin/6-carboxytetrahydropterin synthase